MKKMFLLLCSAFFMCVLAVNACPCQTDLTSDQPRCESSRPCCDNPDENVIKQESCCYGLTQIEIFNRLCLSQCQMDKVCCIYKQFKCDYLDLKNKLNCAKASLCQMIKTCAPKCEIKCQEQKVKDLRKDMNTRFECYQNQIKEVLTKQQFKDYKCISKEENSKYKKLIKNKCCCKQT